MQQTVSSHRITPGFLWFLIQLDSRKNYNKVFNNPYIIVNLVMLYGIGNDNHYLNLIFAGTFSSHYWSASSKIMIDGRQKQSFWFIKSLWESKDFIY